MMASEREVVILMVVISMWTLSLADLSSTDIAVYWGTKGDGSLAETCATGNYNIVFISFLNNFGCDIRNPQLELKGICGGETQKDCATLESEIKGCQGKGVKVFLSLGGPTGSYSACSADYAKHLADYLYVFFLSEERPGPLGKVALDGIHFDIQTGSDNLHWDNLVKELFIIRQVFKSKFRLSAAPGCFIPDDYLDDAIQTQFFDYIFVRYYNDKSCQYSDASMGRILNSWKSWTIDVSPKTKNLFMELPASKDSAEGGYIPPDDLFHQVLPNLAHQETRYAGVALWNRQGDLISSYSKNLRSLANSTKPSPGGTPPKSAPNYYNM